MDDKVISPSQLNNTVKQIKDYTLNKFNEAKAYADNVNAAKTLKGTYTNPVNFDRIIQIGDYICTGYFINSPNKDLNAPEISVKFSVTAISYENDNQCIHQVLIYNNVNYTRKLKVKSYDPNIVIYNTWYEIETQVDLISTDEINMNFDIPIAKTGYIKKGGMAFMPYTNESLVVDDNGTSINNKYATQKQVDSNYGYALQQIEKNNNETQQKIDDNNTVLTNQVNDININLNNKLDKAADRILEELLIRTYGDLECGSFLNPNEWDNFEGGRFDNGTKN